MLSRVADAVYWMSRYVERAENVARFVDVTLQLSLDLPGNEAEQWRPLVLTTGDEKYFNEHYGEASRANVVKFLTFDEEYPNSVVNCLELARENARSVRETIASEMWEQLNEFYHMVQRARSDAHVIDSPNEFFREIKRASHLFQGISDATMSHGEGWSFLQTGKMMERADKTSRLLDVKFYYLLPSPQHVGSPLDDLQWSAVLRSVSGFEMFRKRHHGITPERVVGFLVLDRQFPRAVMYCIDAADASLHGISGSPRGTFWNDAEKRLGRLRNDLAYTNVQEIIHFGLHEFLDDLQTKINDIDDAIHRSYISLESAV